MPISAAARFYIEGRDDAAEDFQVDDYDLAGLAARALAGDDLREVLKQAIAADLATDAHDGTKDEWMSDHELVAEEARVDIGDAYEEWCRGYMDRGAFEIEQEIDNSEVLEVAVEETTAVETPRSKTRRSSSAKPNPLDHGTNYGDYFSTGIQDCQNVYSDDDLNDELTAAAEKMASGKSTAVADLAREAVDAYWKASEPEAKSEWVSQNRDDVESEDLDVDLAYKEWSAGWRLQAATYAAQEIVRRARAIAEGDD